MSEVRDAAWHRMNPTCMDCPLPYSEFPLDAILPRSQWLEINPLEGGLLCPNCMWRRLAKIKGAIVMHMFLEIAPHE